MKKLLLLLSILFLLVSCQPYHPLSKHNYYIQSRLYNESLELQVQYFGDTQLKSLSDLPLKEIKRKIQNLEGLKAKDLLAYGTTNVNPEYKVFLFIQENNRKLDVSNGSKGSLVFRDTLSNSVLFKKINPDKTAYLYIKAKNNNNSLHSLVKDGESIINSLSIGAEVKEELTYNKVFNAVKDSPNYLKARKKLNTAPVEKTEANEWMQFQYLATINSFFSNNEDYKNQIEEFEANRKNQLKPILDTLLQNPEVKVNKGVLDEISELAKETRVVMLNENHWYPKHRVFAIKLLKKLKENGYTHLALEALFPNQDRKINERGFPTLNAGYYIREPNFGQLIRKAKELGFILVGYENQNQEINRELGQAQNLQHILEEDPNHKIFVYAGLDHILEEETKSGKRMAAYFKELTGLNPLTINQSDVIGNSQNELSLIPTSMVSTFEKLDKPVDYFVINNLESNFQESIDQEMETQEFTIEPKRFADLNANEILIKIFKKSEYDIYKNGSVPLQATLKKQSQEPILFSLPPGNYTIHFSSVENNEILVFNKTLER
ncbi:hypothetical protein [Salegentibacter sp. Hel_I_6]|uniref:hypothetical protein n=1 Tax=Salegentibacter sp. Hel_I_6 TaxID=1250278 RepID=UPI0012E0B4A1|nr:hypothetical protein [Salegentibacter sp. Hel_I_6]